MSAVVLPAASADFTSTQVIFSNSTRSACARGAARADPAASTREAVPPAINISKECETEPTRMSFLLSAKTRIPQYSDARQKITQIHYYHDYNSSFARFSYASENVLGDPLLEDLRALVEFARPGPIAGAADRLFQTPSAITRQVQRLEAALGAELLDRSLKPPRLNSLGSRVLEQARDLLQRTEALKSLTSSDAEPHALLRIGLAHALAEGTLIEPIRALTEKYPKVQPRLTPFLNFKYIEEGPLAGSLSATAI